jgi:putative peptide zinc metalloprotease protein
MITQQLMTGLWRRFRGKAPQHVVALTAAAALLAGLTGMWRPDGETYRPVQPYERVTLADATTSVFPQSGAALRDGKAGSTIEPALRIAPAGWERPAPPWAFPFDPPAAPEEDGNQALAVNTTDGSVAHSVEFSLVWAEDGDPVDTTNEAYAFANCTGCAAVAVGFQVVLLEERAEVIAPRNHSAAVNYNCPECHTNALANQLVLSVGCGLSDDRMEQLSALWDEIDAYGRNLEYSTNLQNVPLSEIQARLEAYKQQIVAIVQTGDDESTAPSPLAPTQAVFGDPPPSSVPTVEAPAPTADTFL